MSYNAATLQELLRIIITNADSHDIDLFLDKAEFGRFCFEYFKQIARSKCAGVNLSEIADSCDLNNSEPEDDQIIFEADDTTDIFVPPDNRVVAKVPIAYPEELPSIVPHLAKDTNPNIEYKPVLRRNGVSIECSLDETLIVVNTLAAKHAEIRGGAWSGLGKRLELPLMLTLAKLYQVPSSHYAGKGLTGENREVDFHFLSSTGDQFFCEVKLMGKGNPESADSTIARRSNIFIAQTLSDKNKSQLTNRGHHWVELGAKDGYKRIHTVFTYLDIPCVEFDGDLDAALDEIIPQVFAEIA